MKAPFPWFGGKSRAAHIIWERFGNVPNYVEPFAGSLAMLLARPHPPGIETVNDADCYLANFWRALVHAPGEVSRWANWPVNEADLLARHKWLINQCDFRQRMKSEPDFFDAQIAGWWVWGQSAWLGSGWCRAESQQLPHLGNAGMGINRKLPHLGDVGRGILSYLTALSDRMRKVRVSCGDWSRVLGPSPTHQLGITAVLLDPPYDVECSQEYSVGNEAISAQVREWAIANGDHHLLRIALCGYDGEHTMPASWECVPWKAKGGYGSQGQGQGRENSHRERIWFSPHCLWSAQEDLWSARA